MGLVTDTNFEKAFQNDFYETAIFLINTQEKNEKQAKDWEVTKRLIGNPDALKNK